MEITSGTTIPAGVRDFEAEILYTEINAQTLQNTYGKRVYYDVPSFFTNISVQNTNAMDGNKVIGTVGVEGNRIVVTFNDEFFNNITSTTTVTNAHIQFSASADEDNITENPTKVTIGNATYELNFAEKEVAYMDRHQMFGGLDLYMERDFFEKHTAGTLLTPGEKQSACFTCGSYRRCIGSGDL